MKVNIQSRDYAEGFWQVRYTLETDQGTYAGPMTIEAPETATVEDLEEVVKDVYRPMLPEEPKLIEVPDAVTSKP